MMVDASRAREVLKVMVSQALGILSRDIKDSAGDE
jgi:hypothetical protein